MYRLTKVLMFLVETLVKEVGLIYFQQAVVRVSRDKSSSHVQELVQQVAKYPCSLKCFLGFRGFLLCLAWKKNVIFLHSLCGILGCSGVDTPIVPVIHCCTWAGACFMASRGEMRERQMHLAAVRKQNLLGGWLAQQGKKLPYYEG